MNARALKWFHARILNVEGGSRFRQNFIKVAQANILAQALPLLVAPLLTRLYSPSDFAAVALFSSILGILLAFATWRFDWSVPNASSRTQAAGLLILGAATLLAISVLSVLIFWIARDYLSFWKGAEVLGPFLMLIPLALIGGGLHQLLQSWFVREANLTAVGRARIAQSMANTGLSIGGGLGTLGAAGLIGSVVLSAWVGIGMLFKHATRLTQAAARLTTKRLKLCWSRFGRESALSSMVSLTNVASLSLLPLLLAQYYTATEVGWFALMQRIALAPIGLITAAVGQSFWAEAARLVREGRPALRRLYLKSTRRLAVLAVPVALICLAGPLFVGPVFGKAEWREAGFVLAALTPMLLGQIVVSPLSHLVVHRKQAWQLYWDIVRFLLIATTIYFCTQGCMSISLTILWVSVVVFVMYLVLFIMNLKCFKE